MANQYDSLSGPMRHSQFGYFMTVLLVASLIPLYLGASLSTLSMPTSMPIRSHLVLMPDNSPSHHFGTLLTSSTEWRSKASQSSSNGNVPQAKLVSPSVTPSVDLVTELSISLTSTDSPQDSSDQIFLRLLSVRVALVLLYTVVFLAIFIGNSLLIAALALNREMLTVTNIFLLNLSIADLCVAFFCVYQNLSLYLLSNWIFGDFLCRMYHFIHAMSYTASVCIHVVIAIERYLALVKPFWARVLLTKHRLRLMIVAVWCLSAVACSPRLFIYKTIVSYFSTNGLSEDQHSEILCVISYNLYNPKIYDACYIAIFFALPLMLIGFLYFRISYHLWRSASVPQLSESRLSSFSSSNSSTRFSFKNRRSFRATNHQLNDHPQVQTTELNAKESNRYLNQCKSTRQLAFLGRHSSVNSCANHQYKEELIRVGSEDAAALANQSNNDNTLTVRSSRSPLWSSLGSVHKGDHLSSKSRASGGRHYLQMERILNKRRKVVKLMIAIVICFALFSVPFHLRKLLQHFYAHYDVASDLATMFTLLTTLLLYANSAVSPILYMCFSTKIRRLMLTAVKQLLCCQCPSNASEKHRNNYSISLRSMPDRSLMQHKDETEEL